MLLNVHEANQAMVANKFQMTYQDCPPQIWTVDDKIRPLFLGQLGPPLLSVDKELCHFK